jgi:hypothetical protein
LWAHGARTVYPHAGWSSTRVGHVAGRLSLHCNPRQVSRPEQPTRVSLTCSPFSLGQCGAHVASSGSFAMSRSATCQYSVRRSGSGCSRRRSSGAPLPCGRCVLGRTSLCARGDVGQRTQVPRASRACWRSRPPRAVRLDDPHQLRGGGAHDFRRQRVSSSSDGGLARANGSLQLLIG